MTCVERGGGVAYSILRRILNRGATSDVVGPMPHHRTQPSVTALHEAAHCAAHKFLLGHAPETATILRDADAGSLGHVQPSDGWDDEPSARAAVIASLAGLAAELHIGVPTAHAHGSAEGDLASAREILEQLGEAARLEEHVARACAFVAERWDVIVLLARDLDVYSTLAWEEIDMRLDGCDDASMARMRTLLRRPSADANEGSRPDLG